MGHPAVVRFLSPHPSCLRNDGHPRFGVGSMGEEKNWIANMELDNEGHVAMSCVGRVLVRLLMNQKIR